jgi:hypothetical protein
VSRTFVVTAILIAALGFVDSASATNSRAQVKQAKGRRATTRSQPSA